MNPFGRMGLISLIGILISMRGNSDNYVQMLAGLLTGPGQDPATLAKWAGLQFLTYKTDLSGDLEQQGSVEASPAGFIQVTSRTGRVSHIPLTDVAGYFTTQAGKDSPQYGGYAINDYTGAALASFEASSLNKVQINARTAPAISAVDCYGNPIAASTVDTRLQIQDDGSVAVPSSKVWFGPNKTAPGIIFGTGSPVGAVYAYASTLYIEVNTSDIWQKVSGDSTDATNWRKVNTHALFFAGNPNGTVNAPSGTIGVQTDAASSMIGLWIKMSDTGSLGWALIPQWASTPDVTKPHPVKMAADGSLVAQQINVGIAADVDVGTLTDQAIVIRKGAILASLSDTDLTSKILALIEPTLDNRYAKSADLVGVTSRVSLLESEVSSQQSELANHEGRIADLEGGGGGYATHGSYGITGSANLTTGDVTGSVTI